MHGGCLPRRKRDCTSRKREVICGVLSQLNDRSLEDRSSAPVVRRVLKRRINREPKTVCGSQKRSEIYEKISFRFNCSCSSPFTTQPERPSALGLLSSWLPLRLLASPLLASRLLVCRLLASGLLVLVPRSSDSRCGPVLTPFMPSPFNPFEIVGALIDGPRSYQANVLSRNSIHFAISGTGH